MRKLLSRSSLMALFAGLALFGRTSTLLAADSNTEVADADRFDRLERRILDLAERHEQLLRRLGAQLDRPASTPPPASENVRPTAPSRSGQAAPAAQISLVGGVLNKLRSVLRLVFFVGVICNLLMALWIFTDIRKRGEGSIIFIAMALVAGIPAALIYAVTRIGDKKP